MPEASDARATQAGPALREAKQRLRTAMTAARDAMPHAERAAASAAIAERLASLPVFRDARCVLVTFPFRSEWDTRLIVARAFRAGQAIAAPRVDPVRRMLELRRVDDLERDLAPGHLGITEPRPDCAIVAPDEIDCVVVPGLAFDAHGGRLGYGGGFYDRLMPSIPAHAARIAGAFERQIVDAVPTAPHDLAVAWIATEARLIDARG